MVGMGVPQCGSHSIPDLVAEAGTAPTEHMAYETTVRTSSPRAISMIIYTIKLSVCQVLFWCSVLGSNQRLQITKLMFYQLY